MNDEEMARMLEAATNESKTLGLEINLVKTKLMIIDRRNTVQLNKHRNG